MPSVSITAAFTLFLPDRGTPVSVYVMFLWKYLGMGIVILTAAYLAVPYEIYEAAQMDGAGKMVTHLKNYTSAHEKSRSVCGCHGRGILLQNLPGELSVLRTELSARLQLYSPVLYEQSISEIKLSVHGCRIGYHRPVNSGFCDSGKRRFSQGGKACIKNTKKDACGVLQRTFA